MTFHFPLLAALLLSALTPPQVAFAERTSSRGLRRRRRRPSKDSVQETMNVWDRPTRQQNLLQANDDSETTSVDTPVTIPVLSNDGGDELQILSITVPSNGQATINTATETITYTPNPGFMGTDEFLYTIIRSSDSFTSSTATVTITVSPNLNNKNPPSAMDDVVSTPIGTTITIQVLENDVDPDGDTLRVISNTSPLFGTATIGSDGTTVVYTPNEDYEGGTDQFFYTITDGQGGFGVGRITVNVIPPANAPPTAQDDFATTVVNTPVEIAVLENDTDPNDGDVLQITAVTRPTDGRVFTVAGEGRVVYTPDENFVGEDSFTYLVSDGKGGTDTATVTVVVTQATGTENTPPLAVDDMVTTTQGVSIQINVLENDSDPDTNDVLTIQSVAEPMHGTATIVDMILEYTPDAEFIGTDMFQYTIQDSQDGLSTAMVTVEVTTSDGAPINPSVVTAQDDQATTVVDTPIAISVLDNDEGSTQLLIASVTDPLYGQALLNPTAGTITYIPESGFVGMDRFDYTILLSEDPAAGTDTATVTIEVSPALGLPQDCKPAFAECQTAMCFNNLIDDATGGWYNSLARDQPFACDLKVDINEDCSSGTIIGRVDGTATYDATTLTAMYYFTYTVEDSFPMESVHVNADIFQPVPARASGEYAVDPALYSVSKTYDPMVRQASGSIRVRCPLDKGSVHTIFFTQVCPT